MTDISVAEPGPGLEVTADLGDAIGRVRRALRRRIHDSGDFTPLDDAQLELLRVLRRLPNLRIRDAAAALHLRPNTVSTLATRLAEAGLVERRADPEDGRGACLNLTPAARRRMVRWRSHRQAVLTEAVAGLEAADREAVTRATPALLRLADRLEAGAR